MDNKDEIIPWIVDGQVIGWQTKENKEIMDSWEAEQREREYQEYLKLSKKHESI